MGCKHCWGRGEKKGTKIKWRRWPAAPWHQSQSLKRPRCHWNCVLHVISLKLGFQRGQQERNCKLRKIKYVYFTWVKIMCMSGTENTWSINLAMNRKWQTKELLKKQQNQKTTKTLSQNWKQVMKYNCAMRQSSS